VVCPMPRQRKGVIKLITIDKICRMKNRTSLEIHRLQY